MPVDLRDAAKRLGGDVAGRDSILCAGPGHRHHDRSLSVRFDPAAPGGFVVHSFAGDDPIACRDHVRATLELGGFRGGDHQRPVPARRDPTHESAGNADIAKRLWSSTQQALDTPVQAYLRSRGLELARSGSLRFHPHLKHPSGTFWPCMVAAVTNALDGKLLGVHRTFLQRDGCGKAPVALQKMMLGPCRGGVVRLADASDLVMVGEGIETCLAAMQASGHPAWAALSTSGLRALDLPDAIRDVVILADGDDAGEAAALSCAHRWCREGRSVRVARPPRGLDFNDVLLGRAAPVEEAAR